jgi:hypothetical protein
LSGLGFAIEIDKYNLIRICSVCGVALLGDSTNSTKKEKVSEKILTVYSVMNIVDSSMQEQLSSLVPY